MLWSHEKFLKVLKRSSSFEYSLIQFLHLPIAISETLRVSSISISAEVNRNKEAEMTTSKQFIVKADEQLKKIQWKVCNF